MGRIKYIGVLNILMPHVGMRHTYISLCWVHNMLETNHISFIVYKTILLLKSIGGIMKPLKCYGRNHQIHQFMKSVCASMNIGVSAFYDHQYIFICI